MKWACDYRQASGQNFQAGGRLKWLTLFSPFHLGIFIPAKPRSIFLKLNLDGNVAENEIPLHITVRGKNNAEVVLEDKRTFSFNKVIVDEEASIVADQPLMKRFALVDMADRANEL